MIRQETDHPILQGRASARRAWALVPSHRQAQRRPRAERALAPAAFAHRQPFLAVEPEQAFVVHLEALAAAWDQQSTMDESPADDAACEDVDDEGDVDEARRGGDIGEVRYPSSARRRMIRPEGRASARRARELVRSLGPELPVHVIARAGRGLVAHRRPLEAIADDTAKGRLAHQPHPTKVNGAPRDVGVVGRSRDRQPDVPTAVATSLQERRGRVDRAGQIGPTP